MSIPEAACSSVSALSSSQSSEGRRSNSVCGSVGGIDVFSLTGVIDGRLSSGKDTRGLAAGGVRIGTSASFSPIFVKKLPGLFGDLASAVFVGAGSGPVFFVGSCPNDLGLGKALSSRAFVRVFGDLANAGRIGALAGGAALGGVNGFADIAWSNGGSGA